MILNKITKILSLVLIIGIITIGIVIFLQTKSPAQKEVPPPINPLIAEPSPSTTTQSATSTAEGQVDTSDWKTYRNDTYGFQFKYPAVYEEFKGCGLREENNIIFLGNRIEIQIGDSKGLFLDEYVNEYISQSFHTDLGDQFELKNLTISGNPAIEITYRLGKIGRFGESVFLLHGGKIYKFSVVAGPSCIKNILEIETFQKILSTFQLIDK
jgi:hypothetical protein